MHTNKIYSNMIII